MGMIDCKYHGYSVLAIVSKNISECVERKEHPSTMRVRKIKIDIGFGEQSENLADDKAIDEWVNAGLLSMSDLRTTSDEAAATVFFALGDVCGNCLDEWLRKHPAEER